MSENETFQLKEILVDHLTKSENFEKEVRKDLKAINEKIMNKIESVIKVLTDYMLANDKRVGELEGEQKVTKKEIAIYIGIAGTFIMLVINTYMTFKGG